MDPTDTCAGSHDLASMRVVTATAGEIELAEKLRRLIEQQYLVGSRSSDPYWCVGAD